MGSLSSKNATRKAMTSGPGKICCNKTKIDPPPEDAPEDGGLTLLMFDWRMKSFS